MMQMEFEGCEQRSFQKLCTEVVPCIRGGREGERVEPFKKVRNI